MILRGWEWGGADRFDGWYAIYMMADRCQMQVNDSERLRVFGNRLTDRHTDISDSRVAFATEKLMNLVIGLLMLMYEARYWYPDKDLVDMDTDTAAAVAWIRAAQVKWEEDSELL